MSCVYRGEAAAGLRAFLSHGRRRCGRPTQTSQVRFVCAEQSGLARLCRSATSASAMWRERAAGTLDVLLSQVRSGRSAAIHQTHVLARIRTPTHTHTHTRTRTRKHTQAHTDTLTHAHMHTHPPPPSRRATVREAALHSCWVSSTKLHVRPDVTGGFFVLRLSWRSRCRSSCFPFTWTTPMWPTDTDESSQICLRGTVWPGSSVPVGYIGVGHVEGESSWYLRRFTLSGPQRSVSSNTSNSRPCAHSHPHPHPHPHTHTHTQTHTGTHRHPHTRTHAHPPASSFQTRHCSRGRSSFLLGVVDQASCSA